MPRFVKDGHAVETANAREGVTLRAQGYKEQKARTRAVRKADHQKADTAAEQDS